LSPLTLIHFFVTETAPTEIYTLSLHDALPIWKKLPSLMRTSQSEPLLRSMRRTWMTLLGGRWLISSRSRLKNGARRLLPGSTLRSEEHTSELQSLTNLVCRLLLAKKNNNDALT